MWGTTEGDRAKAPFSHCGRATNFVLLQTSEPHFEWGPTTRLVAILLASPVHPLERSFFPRQVAFPPPLRPYDR